MGENVVGGVQGKLDKIAKDKKFNVQIGDKNLKTQPKYIRKHHL